MILLLLVVSVLMIVAGKCLPPRRRVAFRLQRTRVLDCGCVLLTDDLGGPSEMKPCAAHTAMANSLGGR